MKLNCVVFEIQSIAPPLHTKLTEEEIIQLAQTENYYIVIIDNPLNPSFAMEDGSQSELNKVFFSNAGGIVTLR